MQGQHSVFGDAAARPALYAARRGFLSLKTKSWSRLGRVMACWVKPATHIMSCLTCGMQGVNLLHKGNGHYQFARNLLGKTVCNTHLAIRFFVILLI